MKYLYNEIGKKDVLNMAQNLLRSGALYQRDVDGKLEADGKLAWETPWYHVHPHESINCQLWSAFMWKVMFQSLPKWVTRGRQFLPSGCQNCFKVVVRPQTLKALFALAKVQEGLNRPCKCGIERRAYVFGNYGGYFYNRGLKQGIECYQEVRKAVDDEPELGPDVKVILKRACTEMEELAGPSDKWEIFEDQMEIETEIYETFNIDNQKRSQSRMGINYVKARWVEHAYSVGDITALDYIDPDRPIYPPYVTYHHMKVEDLEPGPVSK
ncbi:MAG: hypothetical protein GY841_12525 [FCB group bacterium]|nr:hypothetical protein [FCB group bacterium]